MKLNKTSSYNLLLLAAVLLTLVMSPLYGCTKKGESDIKVGAIIPLTGPFASYGEPVRDGMMLAIEEINKGGGINGKKVKLIIEDDTGDPKNAVNAFSKLVSVDKVPIVLGPLSSGSSMATAPIAEKSNVVQLSTLAGIPALTNAGDFVFRIYPSSEEGARFAAQKAIEKFKPKKIAILYMNNPFGESARKIYLEAAKNAGIKVVSAEAFQDGEKDFSSQISKVKQEAPDILFCSAYWQDGANILVKLHELGVKIPVVGEDGWRGPLFNLVGANGLKQLYFADILFGKGITNNTVMQKHISDFENKYNKKATPYSAIGFDAVNIARSLIAAGNNSGETIKNAMYKLDYKGATGNVKFDQNGDDVGLNFGMYQLDNKNESILVQK